MQQHLGGYIASKFTTRWIRSENTKLVARAWGLQMRPKAPYYYTSGGKSGGAALDGACGVSAAQEL